MQTVTVSCQVDAIAKGDTICKMAFYKGSPQELLTPSHKGNLLAKMTPTKVTSGGSQPEVPVNGNMSLGILNLTFPEVTCADGGRYQCEVTILAKGSNQTENNSESCLEENRNLNERASAVGVLTVQVPVSQVKLTPTFERPDTNTVDMFLTCSVQTSRPIKKWKWEMAHGDHGWTAVDASSHKVTRNSSHAVMPACSVFYSTLFHVLRATDVYQRYRCYVITDDGKKEEFAAYFTVPMAAVQGRLVKTSEGMLNSTNDTSREFVRGGDEITKNTKSKAGGTSTLMTVAAVMGVVGLLAVIAGVAAGATRSRKRKQSDDPTSQWPRDDMDKLDGVGFARFSLKPGTFPVRDDDEVSVASSQASTRASSMASSVASGVSSSVGPEDSTELTQGLGGTRGTGLSVLFGENDATPSEVGSMLVSSTGVGSEVGSAAAGSEVASDVSERAGP
ncbi:uncharacterized protein [Littorina saxatilis]|uniref:uncharacterized protein isoform X2 n=1 Tax=Littorina saxatilis TaxID=31220 RepID=UPI0038B58210